MNVKGSHPYVFGYAIPVSALPDFWSKSSVLRDDLAPRYRTQEDARDNVNLIYPLVKNGESFEKNPEWAEAGFTCVFSTEELRPMSTEASKLPPILDAALIGATVSSTTAAQFAYSLKALTGLVMLDRQCQDPEARQIIFHELIQPFSGEITFVDDTLLEPQPVEEKSKIIIPKKIGPRKYR